VTALVTLSLGCPLEQATPNPGNQQSDVPAPSQEPTQRTVTVRFRNLAVDEAVDVEFYASNVTLETLPESLFVDQNAVSAGIGIAGTGILEPLREDSLEVPCGESLVLGTLGGSFLDNESGELLGHGVARWVSDAPIGLCGRGVLFEYDNEFGTFTTLVSIGDNQK